MASADPGDATPAESQPMLAAPTRPSVGDGSRRQAAPTANNPAAQASTTISTTTTTTKVKVRATGGTSTALSGGGASPNGPRERCQELDDARRLLDVADRRTSTSTSTSGSTGAGTGTDRDFLHEFDRDADGLHIEHVDGLDQPGLDRLVEHDDG